MKRLCLTLVLFILSFAWFPDTILALGKETSKADCPSAMEPKTQPTSVNMPNLFAKLTAIKTVDGKLAYNVDENLIIKLHEIFDPTKTRTKMEQFYAMLFAIQNASPLPRETQTITDSKLRDLLIESGVFPNVEFPQLISEVQFRRSSLTPYYQVSFNQPEVSLLPSTMARVFGHGSTACAKAPKH